MSNQNLNSITKNNIELCDNATLNPSFENLFSPILFALDGKRSDDEWLAYSLIEDLVDLRIMTCGQLFRWIYTKDKSKSEEQACEFVAELIRHELIDRMPVKVPMPQSNRVSADGKIVLIETSIVFLTERCKTFISEHNRKFVRFGLPEGVDYERIYHDLLIVEAILLLSKYYLICGIKSENKLKSEAQKLNNEAASVADFHVCLDKYNPKKQTSSLKFIAGEVVVQAKSHSIWGKPKGTIFFTPNLRVADVIKNVRDENAIMLEDVTLPINSVDLFNYSSDLVFNPKRAFLCRKISELWHNGMYGTDYFETIFEHLNMHGPLTEDALAALMGMHRGTISKKLSKLIAANFIHFEGIQPEPGLKPGRPCKLFSFIEVDLRSFAFRKKQLKLSHSIVLNNR